MKKLLCLMFLLTLTNYTQAGVVAPSSDSLQDDLSFSLDEQSSESEREVASEESEEIENGEDSDRDIASDVIESSDSKMEYWKY